jgi:hypothetical protein
LRSAPGGFIIELSITGGRAVCNEWWFQRRAQEREASRLMWEEFERTRPISDPGVTEEEPEVTLEQPETQRLESKE